MKQNCQTSFGQAKAYVPVTSTGVDKWRLLEQMTQGAAHLDLSHRELAVLRALLSFYPNRALPLRAGVAVVFPSNRTLASRLGGIPESTLRRHLSRLVRLGFVSRQDSANRKRFSVGSMAFGFDLAPLSQRAAEIAQAAEKTREAAAAAKHLRACLLALRQKLLALSAGADLIDDIARYLRRKPDLTFWDALKTKAEELLKTMQMSGENDQNERHIEHKERKKLEPDERAGDDITLGEVQQICKERACYFPRPLRSWGDVVQDARQLAPMMGIDDYALDQAERQLGKIPTAVAILCTLEKLASIDNPGGYLRWLAQKGRAGGEVIAEMVQSLLNRGNCQLTTEISV